MMCLLPVTELLDLTKVHPYFFSSVLAKTLISQVVPLSCQTASDTLSKAVGIVLTQVLTLCSLGPPFYYWYFVLCGRSNSAAGLSN